MFVLLAKDVGVYFSRRLSALFSTVALIIFMIVIVIIIVINVIPILVLLVYVLRHLLTTPVK